jgi:MFS transporter, PAT family, beta-lactamase induction signal transducer AmpG
MFGFNILATKWGRLVAFFLLYVTEGIPNGFATVAITRRMREDGLSVKYIGLFTAALVLPWAFKWAMGPIVDLFYSDRIGRRRAWIVAMQGLMCVTLLAALFADYKDATPVFFVDVCFLSKSWSIVSLAPSLFTLILIVHNIFAATQDVAIDALACGTLKEKERGLANGLMFAGAFTGQFIGGPLVQRLWYWDLSLNGTFFFVIACILAITLGVALQLREPKGEPPPHTEGSRFRAAAVEIQSYVRQAGRAFFGSRPAFVGCLFALLPMGALSLSLALQTALTVELRLDGEQVSNLNAVTIVIAIVCCVLGGLLSDRFGRRRTLALYILGTIAPTLFLAYVMYRQGWIMPIDPQLSHRPMPSGSLIVIFWVVNIVFSVFQGLYYGSRTALFMDVCTPAVAATQFTAYMALMNLVTSYSSAWQGAAIDAWGYPVTLVLDSAAGLICLIPLSLMRPTAAPEVKERQPMEGGQD